MISRFSNVLENRGKTANAVEGLRCIGRCLCFMLLAMLPFNLKAQSSGVSGSTPAAAPIVPLVLTYWGWFPSIQTIPPGPITIQVTNQTLLPTMALKIRAGASSALFGQTAPAVFSETEANATGVTFHKINLTNTGDYTLGISSVPAFTVKLTVKAQ